MDVTIDKGMFAAHVRDMIAAKKKSDPRDLSITRLWDDLADGLAAEFASLGELTLCGITYRKPKRQLPRLHG